MATTLNNTSLKAISNRKKREFSAEDLLESLPCHVYLCKLSKFTDINTTKILYADAMALDYTGHSQTNGRKRGFRHFKEIIHPDFLDIPLPWLQSMLRKPAEKGLSGLCQIKSRDNQYHWFHCQLNEYHSDDFKSDPLFIFTASKFDLTKAVIKQHIEVQTAEDRKQNQHIIDQITRQEYRVLQLIVKGKKYTEIAEILHISEDTALTHRHNLLKKTGTPNLPALAVFAIKNGLCE